MPYHVEHRPVKDGRDWAIIRDTDGKIVGRSRSKEAAQSSINARNAGKHGWKGMEK